MKYKIKNYQYLIGSSVIRIICVIIATYIFTNYFSIKEFATYNIILSSGIIITGLSTSPQYYFLANNQNKKNLLYSTRENNNLIIMIFIILILIIYFFKNFIFPEDTQIFFYVLTAISLSLIIQIVLQNISRIEQNYNKYFKVSIAERFFLVMVLLFSFLFNIELKFILVIFTSLCLIFFLIFVIKNKYIKLNINIFKNRSLFRETSYSFVNNIITISIGLQSLVVISGQLNQYGIANSISIGILILSMATFPLGWIETVLGPIISRIIKTKNKKILNNFIMLNFKNVLFLCFLSTILTISLCLIPNLFELFFPKYIDYKKIIFIFSFLIPVLGSKLYLSWFIVCLKKTKFIFLSHVILLIFLGLTFYLLDFNLKKFLFYYVLLSITEVLIVYTLFTFFYKVNNILDIYLIFFLTIINLIAYSFYFDIYNIVILTNLVYLTLYLKKNNLRVLIIKMLNN